MKRLGDIIMYYSILFVVMWCKTVVVECVLHASSPSPYTVLKARGGQRVQARSYEPSTSIWTMHTDCVDVGGRLASVDYFDDIKDKMSIQQVLGAAVVLQGLSRDQVYWFNGTVALLEAVGRTMVFSNTDTELDGVGPLIVESSKTGTCLLRQINPTRYTVDPSTEPITVVCEKVVTTNKKSVFARLDETQSGTLRYPVVVPLNFSVQRIRANDAAACGRECAAADCRGYYFKGIVKPTAIGDADCAFVALPYRWQIAQYEGKWPYFGMVE